VKSFSKEQQAILLLLGLAIFLIALCRPFHPFWSTFRPSHSKLTTESQHQWIVEVSGAVRNPGIYAFDKPPTPHHVIQNAGGSICKHLLPLDKADDPLINTGIRLELQESERECARVIITPMGSEKRLVLGIPIALNQAGVEDLAIIPGISQSLALRIVKFRKSHGPFKRWSDLRAVNGVGPKKVQAFRSYLILK